MRYFRNVVAVVAAATVFFCSYRPSLFYRNVRSICMAYSYDIMPSCRRLLCFIVLMKMNDVMMWTLFKLRRQNENHTSYINTVNRTTQYNLYILQKYVQSIQFLNCDEQFLKKNRKRGSFKQSVRETAFFKNITYTPKSTVQYGASSVLVRWWCGVCSVLVRCFGA